MISLFVLCSILLCLILVTGLRLKRTLNAGSRLNQPQNVLERSPSFYAPMERLLAETDFQFLKTRPEISSGAIHRMRRERRKIFRGYLDCLAVDFAAITKEIRTVMIASNFSRADLAGTLLRARLLFAITMLAIEIQLVLHACGIHKLAISPGRLTLGLAEMQRELRQLSLGPAYFRLAE